MLYTVNLTIRSTKRNNNLKKRQQQQQQQNLVQIKTISITKHFHIFNRKPSKTHKFTVNVMLCSMLNFIVVFYF